MDNIQLKEQLQEEAETAHKKCGYKSTICASVGSGKSKIAINRIKDWYGRTSSPKIIFTGAREIYLLTFKNELLKFGLEDRMDDITFCCVASLKNYAEIDWDLIIVDEAHKDIERIFSFINNFKNKRTCEILLLTGTPVTEKNYIAAEIYKICPISFRKNIDDSIKDTLVNDYEISIITHRLDETDKYIKYGNYGLQTERQKYNFLYKCWINSRLRSRRKFPFELANLKIFFKNLQSKKLLAEAILRKIKKKVLIYAGSIEQAQSMGMLTYHSNLNKQEREDNLDKFIKGGVDRLVNVAGIRESANIPNLKYGIIMAPDASENAFEQTVGRFSRLVIGEKAHIFVLCAVNTVEEVWVNKAIRRLDSTKINKINIEQIEDIYQ